MICINTHSRRDSKGTILISIERAMSGEMQAREHKMGMLLGGLMVSIFSIIISYVDKEPLPKFLRDI